VQRLILVTGGARSGKSDFAQALAQSLGGEDVLFVATAEAGDEDMAHRIAAHQQARPAAWRTVEAPRRVGQAIRQAASAKVVLVDCLTLLVSNVLLSLGEEPTSQTTEAAVYEEVSGLVEAAREAEGSVIVVTNEVGLGIVPANRLARLYRDVLGRANATLARESEQVYLLVSGLPLEVKSLARKGGA
jgi:adenosylcobinamide kinase / adenosylcobinamide-phosphate guanylyltransferase